MKRFYAIGMKQPEESVGRTKADWDTLLKETAGVVRQLRSRQRGKVNPTPAINLALVPAAATRTSVPVSPAPAKPELDFEDAVLTDAGFDEPDHTHVAYSDRLLSHLSRAEITQLIDDRRARLDDEDGSDFEDAVA
jgi:hypothetical protein